jgi:hypothetical protein
MAAHKNKEILHILKRQRNAFPTTSLGGGHTHCRDDVSYGAALKIAQVTHDEGYVAMLRKIWTGGCKQGSLIHRCLDGFTMGSFEVCYYSSIPCLVRVTMKPLERHLKKETYRKFEKSQINYALGDNPRGGSY